MYEKNQQRQENQETNTTDPLRTGYNAIENTRRNNVRFLPGTAHFTQISATLLANRVK